MRLDTAIEASSQSAHQADGYSPLEIIGETEVTFMRTVISSTKGLIVEGLDVEILPGTPLISPLGLLVAKSLSENLLTNTGLLLKIQVTRLFVE